MESKPPTPNHQLRISWACYWIKPWSLGVRFLQRTTWCRKDLSHKRKRNLSSRWFQIFVIFTPIWGRFPPWLIFFRWVETTNQSYFEHTQHVLRIVFMDDSWHVIWFVPNEHSCGQLAKIGKEYEKTHPNCEGQAFPPFKKKPQSTRGFPGFTFFTSQILAPEVFFFPPGGFGEICGMKSHPTCQALNHHLGLPVPTTVAVREFPGILRGLVDRWCNYCK